MAGNTHLFGSGGLGGPIRVDLSDDPEFPFSFNNSSRFVVSINENVVKSSSVVYDIFRNAPESLSQSVVFELFSAEILNFPIEIGSRVPTELAMAFLESCARNSVPLNDLYKIHEDGRFGYCQRLYIGSRKPSGARVKGNQVSELLDNLSLSNWKGVKKFDPQEVARELLAVSGNADAKTLITELIRKTPSHARSTVMREFLHLWRRIPPSRREGSGVNDARRILERNFPESWDF